MSMDASATWVALDVTVNTRATVSRWEEVGKGVGAGGLGVGVGVGGWGLGG